MISKGHQPTVDFFSNSKILLMDFERLGAMEEREKKGYYFALHQKADQ